MSEETKKETTPAPEAQQAAPAAEPAPAAPAAQAEPQIKAKAGLFRDFTLGSRLQPGPTGNVIANVKQSPMDYEKTYQSSTRNQKMTAEELAALNKKGQ